MLILRISIGKQHSNVNSKGAYSQSPFNSPKMTLSKYPKPNSTNRNLALSNNFFRRTQQTQSTNQKTIHIQIKEQRTTNHISSSIKPVNSIRRTSQLHNTGDINFRTG
jgi:hypothetical protein